jgi:hypothetical protein
MTILSRSIGDDTGTKQRIAIYTRRDSIRATAEEPARTLAVAFTGLKRQPVLPPLAKWEQDEVGCGEIPSLPRPATASAHGQAK